jgi:hypothetical protein
MNGIVYSDEVLRKAAGLVRKSILISMPKPSACKYDFSKEFQKKMNYLMKKERRCLKTRKIATRVLAFFLVVLIGTSTWLATDTEARTAVFNWVREVFENSIIYRFFGNDIGDSGVVSPDYTPYWLPDGYNEADVYIDKTMCSTYYQNDATGSGIVFEYYAAEDGTQLELLAGNEDYIYEKIEIDGYLADYYEAIKNSNTNNLIWVDKQLNLVFCIYSDLEKSDIIRIAESVSYGK